MQNYDDLYNMLNQVTEDQKRENFNTFMNGLVDDLSKDLDNAYIDGSVKGCPYEKLLSNVKEEGFKVFRNSEGKHKIII